MFFNMLRSTSNEERLEFQSIYSQSYYIWITKLAYLIVFAQSYLNLIEIPIIARTIQSKYLEVDVKLSVYNSLEQQRFNQLLPEFEAVVEYCQDDSTSWTTFWTFIDDCEICKALQNVNHRHSEHEKKKNPKSQDLIKSHDFE